MLRPLPLVCAIVALAGCTGSRSLPPSDAPLPATAAIPGYEDVRAWGDSVPENDDGGLAEIREGIAARARAEGALPNDGRYDILVLSSGGSDGAYGAGLMKGWTERGERPEFQLVTGISTGALIAPFAFLGPEYDDALEQLYTATPAREVVELNVLRAMFGWALGLADITALEVTLDDLLAPEVVDRIAEEHAKGRRLWIGTTNLDAQRPVIWDVGAVAASDQPDRRELIRDILLASSAIPGAFPPVEFTVDIDGTRHSEMHVDGGVTRQLFVYPGQLRLDEQLPDPRTAIEPGTIYVVRNNKLDPEYNPVTANVLRITQRAISTLIKVAGAADIRLIREQAAGGGWALEVTAVPADFNAVESEVFDPDYMRALFEVGYRRARDDDPWQTVLGPGGEPVEEEKRAETAPD